MPTGTRRAARHRFCPEALLSLPTVVPPGPRPHLVVAAAGGHAVLDVGHQGVDEPRVVAHGLPASVGRAEVPEGQRGGGGRLQEAWSGRPERTGERREEGGGKEKPRGRLCPPTESTSPTVPRVRGSCGPGHLGPGAGRSPTCPSLSGGTGGQVLIWDGSQRSLPAAWAWSFISSLCSQAAGWGWGGAETQSPLSMAPQPARAPRAWGRQSPGSRCDPLKESAPPRPPALPGTHCQLLKLWGSEAPPPSAPRGPATPHGGQEAPTSCQRERRGGFLPEARR